MIVLFLLLLVGPLVQRAEAQQVGVAGIFPRQLPRGQETTVNVAVQNRDTIQAVEVSPPAGVKVSEIKKGEDFQGNNTWSELRIAVASDAAPGERTLVLVLPTGRTAPVRVTIPEHVPVISDLRVLPAQSNPPALGVQFAAGDSSADIGDSPYVWFLRRCGNEIVPGVVHGKVTSRDRSTVVVQASIPMTPAKDKCDFQVRVADSGGIESNTLKTQF